MNKLISLSALCLCVILTSCTQTYRSKMFVINPITGVVLYEEPWRECQYDNDSIAFTVCASIAAGRNYYESDGNIVGYTLILDVHNQPVMPPQLSDEDIESIAWHWAGDKPGDEYIEGVRAYVRKCESYARMCIRNGRRE